jgi:hypothetical protein
MAAAKLVVARESFATTVEGRGVLVKPGPRGQATHTQAKAHPQLFGPVEPEADLEQPTAKRSTRRKRATKQ